MAADQTDLDPVVQDTVEALMAERAQLIDQRAPIDERLEQIKTALGNLLPYGTRTVVGTKVSVQRNQRFDGEKFAANHPVEQYASCYKSTPDKAKIQALLGEDVVRQYTKTFDPKVVIG